MKKVMLINGDLFKSPSTDFLIQSYEKGVEDSGGVYKHIVIADLLFNYNKQFANSPMANLEMDLQKAWRELTWSNHIVLFCPVFKSHIPSKVSGFFDRLFNLNVANNRDFRTNSLYGRSGRIVSILDEELFQEYQLTRKTNFMAIKREIFERNHLSPVYTSRIGHLHSLDNAYSEKWKRKLYKFGLQGI